MTRIKRGVNAHRRHQKVVKAAKGYRGLRSKGFRHAKIATMKAGLHSYAHRKTKKRTFRALWIARINAACRVFGISYSRFIAGLNAKKVAIDRKILSDLAIKEPETFKKIVEFVK